MPRLGTPPLQASLSSRQAKSMLLSLWNVPHLRNPDKWEKITILVQMRAMGKIDMKEYTKQLLVRLALDQTTFRRCTNVVLVFVRYLPGERR